MLAGGLIISRRFVQVRTTPKYRSTHISNYQSSEHESNQHDESDYMKFPCALKNALLIIRNRSGLAFATKRIGLPCCTFVTTTVTCLLQIFLLSNYSATYNFSTCRHDLTENYFSFPSAPRWVWHSYLSKRATIDPIHLWVITTRPEASRQPMISPMGVMLTTVMVFSWK